MAKVYFPTREQVLAITDPLDRRVRKLEGFVRTFKQLRDYIREKVGDTDIDDEQRVSEIIAELKDDLVGVEIPDRWTNTGGTVYEDPMIVVNIGKFKGGPDEESQDGEFHIGAMLMRKYACAETVVFDAAETDIATETTVQADVYYYGSTAASPAAATITILNPDEYNPNRPESYASGMQCRHEGKVWQANKTTSGAWNASAWNDTGVPALNVGNALPSGYTKIYRNSIYDPTRNIIQYGYNNWKFSAYRQYLNSTAEKTSVHADQWWQQDFEWTNRVGNTAPSNVGTVRGYKCGCTGFDASHPEGILKYVKPVYIKTWKNYITDGATKDYRAEDVYETLDTFFLPSGADMYGDVNLTGTPKAGVESELSPYFKAATGLDAPGNKQNAGRIRFAEANKSVGTYVRLRSACRDFSNDAWYSLNTGYATYNSAYAAYASVPACVIY